VDEKTPTSRFGKYTLIAHLATGGMAEIYLAKQLGIAGFEKLLVIKRILPHLAREDMFVQMFLDEARIAARLNHQNVVQIYDLGRVDTQYFIAMEYLEGESLASMMRQARKLHRPLSPWLAAGIALQVSEGLHHAHTMLGPDGEPLSLVHRDVNPQNVFVLYSGGVKLVDFGIAKATNRFHHTTTGTLKGKYGYMSPEQIMSLPLDCRSDVYSAGVVLWEMLTGRKLFRQSSELEILKAITELDPPPPSSVLTSTPSGLDEITMRALKRSRDLRYQSAGEMRMELSFFLKRTAEPSDTVAIGEYMQSIFYDRMMEKRRLIQNAEADGINLEEDLFGDSRLLKPDTEPSISTHTPAFSGARPTRGTSVDIPFLKKSGAGWRRIALWGGLGVLFLAGCGFLYYLIQAPSSGTLSLPAMPPPVDAAPSKAIEPSPPPPILPEIVTSKAAGAPVTRPSPSPREPLAIPKAIVPPPVEPAQVKADPVASTPPPKERLAPKPLPAPVVKKKPRWVGRPVESSQAPGKLRFSTQPWTRVFFKGRELGVTPLVDVELPSGKIQLHVVNEEKNLDRKVEVEIKAGQTTIKSIHF